MVQGCDCSEDCGHPIEFETSDFDFVSAELAIWGKDSGHGLTTTTTKVFRQVEATTDGDVPCGTLVRFELSAEQTMRLHGSVEEKRYWYTAIGTKTNGTIVPICKGEGSVWPAHGQHLGY